MAVERSSRRLRAHLYGETTLGGQWITIRGWWFCALALTLPGCLDPLVEDPSNNSAGQVPNTPILPVTPVAPGGTATDTPTLPVTPNPVNPVPPTPVEPGVTPITPGVTPPATSTPTPVTPPAPSGEATETGDAEETIDDVGAADAGAGLGDSGVDSWVEASEAASSSSAGETDAGVVSVP